MNAESYNELQQRALSPWTERMLDEQEQAKAAQRVKAEMEAMRIEGKILELSDEEERMLRSFRRFKNGCKPGAVFKWQTRPEEGVLISQETGLIRDPQEVA